MVGPNGEQVGIVRVEDALRLAAEADLDLVEVAPMAKPPVAKLMDFGKYKYEAAMKAREARKNQVNTVIKEIKLRPKIDPHDYGTKKGHVVRFLNGGDKVKVTIMFRGREQSRPELGYRLLQRLAQDVVELGTVESAPKQDGRNMIMVLAPTKKKAQAMAEQRRRREEYNAAHGHRDESAEALEALAYEGLKESETAGEYRVEEILDQDPIELAEVEEADAVQAPEVTDTVEAAETPAPAPAAAPAPVKAAPAKVAPAKDVPVRPTPAVPAAPKPVAAKAVSYTHLTLPTSDLV